jgi:hypothetical protein
MRKRSVGVVLVTLVAATWLAGVASPSVAKTVWLCRPGQSPDPCTPGLSTTVYSPKLTQIGVQHPKVVAHPAIDCFYVYPTVSTQKTGNSNLRIEPAERAVAVTQAGRYSQYCRVFAPMYRQETLAGIGYGVPTTKPNVAIALTDVETAFQTYLRQYNHGRGFVLIGHSQGSFVLRQLIAKEVDQKPAVRKLLVSAILLGGNVEVKRGKDVGGDFRYIRACHSASQLGCVIAFSTFDQPVPSASIFGRPLPILGATPHKDDVVLCTNPASLGGGAGLLDPVFPGGGIPDVGVSLPTSTTAFESVPSAYRAVCSSANDANVLQIRPNAGAPALPETLGPIWGLHLVDANIALGNLISIVKSEAAAFAAAGR